MATFEERLNEALTDQQIDAIRVAAGLDKEAQIKIGDLVRAVAVLIRQGELRTRTKMESLLREVNRVIDQGFGGIAAEQITSIKEFSELAATGFTQAVNELAGISLFKEPQRISAGAEKQIIMGAPQADWWEGQAVRMQANFSREVRQGFVAGDTNEQIVQRLVGVRARGDEPAVPGVIEITRRDARSLVHTSVQSVANEARREVFKANDDIIIGVRQVSTLDTRTTLQCMARDQKQWDRDRKPVGHDIAYKGGVGHLHWGCRSVEVPVLRPLVINGVEMGGFRGSQRASMDGPVDGKLTFEDWMKGKGDAFLDEKLGPGRAELFRQGKLTLSDLLDQRGNELTLDQLRDKMDIRGAYAIAKSGGRRGGVYQQAVRMSDAQLEKSIRAMDRQIERHEQKIADPEPWIKPGYPRADIPHLVNSYWPKEIKGFQEEAEIYRRVLQERQRE